MMNDSYNPLTPGRGATLDMGSGAALRLTHQIHGVEGEGIFTMDQAANPGQRVTLINGSGAPVQVACTGDAAAAFAVNPSYAVDLMWVDGRWFPFR